MAVNDSNTISYMDDVEAISEKSAQLRAMLFQTYGEGLDIFRRMSDETRDNYMWACSNMAHEISELANKIMEKR